MPVTNPRGSQPGGRGVSSRSRRHRREVVVVGVNQSRSGGWGIALDEDQDERFFYHNRAVSAPRELKVGDRICGTILPPDSSRGVLLRLTEVVLVHGRAQAAMAGGESSCTGAELLGSGRSPRSSKETLNKHCFLCRQS